MRGLDPRIHLQSKSSFPFRMDCRVIGLKTRFALLPGYDEVP
jgi:hypothetical protein